MSEVKVYNWQGEETGSVKLDPKIFNIEINQGLVHQVVETQMHNSRYPYAHTKDRSEVSGGGRKPWRQKGTGRARHGSSRSPIWIGGGVTFGPRNQRVFNKKLNKKMKNKALLMSLTDKVENNLLKVLDDLKAEKIQTKAFKNLLKNLEIEDSVMFVIPIQDQKIVKSVANLPKARVIMADSLNVVDLLRHKNLVLDKASLDVIKKTYLK